jgi:hypothetical protein
MANSYSIPLKIMCTFTLLRDNPWCMLEIEGFQGYKKTYFT